MAIHSIGGASGLNSVVGKTEFAMIPFRKIESIVHGQPKALFQKTPADGASKVPVLPRPKPRYKVVALGGTFDILHKGHEQLISRAFEIGESVIIGVTTDGFIKKLGKTHPVQPYATRVREVRRFLRFKGWAGRARITPLRDPYGPPARVAEVEALVITPNTLLNARKLNRERKKNGLRVLRILRVQLAGAEDRKPISSTRIRDGEIGRDGRLLRQR